MNFNTGLRGVLFDARHFERMGAAIWLYGWLVLRQTHQSGDVGWVLGGAPVNYRAIEEETGFNRRTLERWMRTLRDQGYVQTQATPGGIIIRITKAKKFPQNRELFHSPARSRSDNFAGAPRNFAERRTQTSVAIREKNHWNQSDVSRIGSSSVERKIEKQNRFPVREIHNQSQVQRQNSSPTENFDAAERPLSPREFLREAQLRRQLYRIEREEAVRRELAVGGGPEVRRP